MGLFTGLSNALFGVPPVSSAPYQVEAQQLQQGAGQYAGQEQGAVASQQQLADSLWNTINGRGPSVADIQLQQALGQGLAQTQAAGAGATGQNAVLARFLASGAGSDYAAKAAQAAALLRAQEIQAAQGQYGQTEGNIASEGAGMYGRNLDTGLGYANIANQANQANAQREQTAQNELLGAAAGVAGGLGGLGSMYLKNSGGSSGSGSGGSTFTPGGNNTSFWSNPTNNAYQGAFGASANAQ
jgi:hypothetical protein